MASKNSSFPFVFFLLFVSECKKQVDNNDTSDYPCDFFSVNNKTETYNI